MHGYYGDPQLPDVHDQLRDRIETVALRTTRPVRAASERLAELPHGDRLLHGDFHPGNVVISRGREVIVDWTNAARGHVLADVAWTCLLIRREFCRDPRCGGLRCFSAAMFFAAFISGVFSTIGLLP